MQAHALCFQKRFYMKNIKNTFYILFFLCFSLSPSTALTKENPPTPTQQTEKKLYGELWTGSLYSSTYRAGACISPQGKVEGVLILRLKNGDEDVYHFSGTRNIQGILDLRHPSGHSFKGSFVSATAIQGKVKTKNGFTVTLKGKRQQHVLLGEKCRPL